ncbi:CDP-glycerol glycerophosphotransferase family protein [Streptomyces sp. NRRL S-87]|uniref:bifunctional glycosyltransferase/CDP-glycerol:glycerophosphate glycerophosphotransferase n=1 Tax=Streptomyces sp. NRRL S-87 TaxID=1463920 RepID=UPI0004C23CD0|nr:CDP-glycerol glycerophosphotransferase family protein [Streptomyces sp. NRRL S-87]
MKPRLSVVIPVHDVAPYLLACLRSVAGQTEPSLEAVLVDDGSTDESGQIARRFANRDSRFRYVRQPHAGPAAARNTGVRHTTPGVPYLTFVDSDDLVAPDAYERMLASLDRTGSDFATGNVWRMRGRECEQSWQYRWLRDDLEATHITRQWELLTDRWAWNKVFRRSFWDRHDLAFPEGRLYEDAPVTIPAHFLADSVDVLQGHVYYWRVREGSLAHRGADVAGVRDRITACEEISEFLARSEAATAAGTDRPRPGSVPRSPQAGPFGRTYVRPYGRSSMEALARPRTAPTGSTGHQRTYDASCLRDDFMRFLRRLPEGSPEYRDTLLAGTAAFLDRAGPDITDGLPVDLRAQYQLVREGRVPELLDLIAEGPVFDVRRHHAVFPGVPLPTATTRLRGATDLPVVARLLSATWLPEGRLRLTGYAYIRNLGAAAPRLPLRTGVLRSGRRLRLVPTRSTVAAEATEQSGQSRHNYDGSGFSMIVDPHALRAGDWHIGVVSGLRRAAVRALDPGQAQPLVFDRGLGTRVTLDFTDGRAVLRVRPYAGLVTGHELRPDGRLALSGTLFAPASGPQAPAQLRVGRPGGEAVVVPVAVDGPSFTALLDPALLYDAPPAPARRPESLPAPDGEVWTAELVREDGTPAELAASPALTPGRYPLCVLTDPYGRLTLEVTERPLLDSAAWDPDTGTLTLAGTCPPAVTAAELVLRHTALHEELLVPLAPVRGRFTASLAPGGGPTGRRAGARRATSAGTPARSLREGEWAAYLREPSGTEHRLRMLATTAQELPLHFTVGVREFTVGRRHGDRLHLTAGSLLPRAERGPYRQRILQTAHYPAHRSRPLHDAVLYAESPAARAVHAELLRRGTEVEHLWVTHDQRLDPPPSATPVELHSGAWYEALARSRRIVTAADLPDWFEKRAEQTVVRLWQGTPVKRVGADLTGGLYADHRRLEALPRLARQWSVLVSPSRFATGVLRRALGHAGEVLEAGSPHNDLLLAPDREKAADELRRTLDLPAGATVVLYAPTFRDHLAHGEAGTPTAAEGPFGFDPSRHLDLPELERSLGSDHVVLVRRHPLATGPALPRTPFLRDVSWLPDPAALLLVADVLVTDYSSLMCDFTLTGRPVLLHTPDLEDYRDRVRGLSLDLERQAPGPLLRTTPELCAALREAPAVRARHADAYASFRSAYCDLDDGRAAARVADRLMAP